MTEGENELPPKETYSNIGPQCPYCRTQWQADDPGYYDTIGYTEDECSHCRKKFAVSVDISASWTCTPIETGGEPAAEAVRVDQQRVDGAESGQGPQRSTEG